MTDWIIKNWVELLGNVLAFANIYLLYRNSVWNWPVGIANCVFYIAMFLPAKLYADSLLQVVYIGLSVYGWWWWLGGRKHVQEPIRRWRDPGGGPHTYTFAIAIFIGSFVLMALFLGRFTNSDVPVWDALLTATCFAATYLMAKRRIENWHVWIASNVGYFALYAHKQLLITQWCQIGFLVLSAIGLFHWRGLRCNRLATQQP